MLARRAAEAPERPWLFHPRGLDWRWLSRGEMARRVGRLAVALSEPLAAVVAAGSGAARYGSPAPAVAFPYRSRPLTSEELPLGEATPPPGLFLPVSAWVVHLALAAAGFKPIALAVEAREDPDTDALTAETARRGAVALVLPGGGDSGPAAAGDSLRWLDDRQLDATAWRIVSREESRAGADEAPPSAEAGGDVSPVTAARRLLDLAGRAPAGRGGVPGDEVAVASRGPADAGDRLLVAWSLLTGGVLLLEANPDARVATAAWSRPTLFLGGAGEVERLWREAQGWEERWRGGSMHRVARWLRDLLGAADREPGLPFGRLHTLVLRGDGAPGTGADADFWSSRGVRRVDLAGLVQ